MAEPAPSPSTGRWPRVPRFIATSATFAALAAILWLNRSDLDALKSITPLAAGFLVVLQVLYLVPQSYRYELIIERHINRDIDSISWFRIFVVGTLLNNFMMQAGLVYRSAALRRLAGVGLTAYVGSYATFAWLSLLLNSVVALVLLGAGSPNTQMGPVPAWSVMATVTALLIAGPILLHRISTAIDSDRRLFRAAHGIITSVVELPRNRAFLGRFLWVSLLATALGTAVVATAAAALDVSVSIGEAALFLALVQIAGLIILTPGNIGLRELAFTAVGGALGTGAVNGLLISAVTRATAIIALLAAAGGARALERIAGRPATPSKTDA